MVGRRKETIPLSAAKHAKGSSGGDSFSSLELNDIQMEFEILNRFGIILKKYS